MNKYQDIVVAHLDEWLINPKHPVLKETLAAPHDQMVDVFVAELMKELEAYYKIDQASMSLGTLDKSSREFLTELHALMGSSAWRSAQEAGIRDNLATQGTWQDPIPTKNITLHFIGKTIYRSANLRAASAYCAVIRAKKEHNGTTFDHEGVDKITKTFLRGVQQMGDTDIGSRTPFQDLFGADIRALTRILETMAHEVDGSRKNKVHAVHRSHRDMETLKAFLKEEKGENDAKETD